MTDSTPRSATELLAETPAEATKARKAAPAPAAARPDVLAALPVAPVRGARGGVSWMLTFTDLVALMLTFFVMLFAMSRVEERRWQNISDALARGLNAVRELPAATPVASLGLEGETPLAGEDLDYLLTLLGEQAASDPALAGFLLDRRRDSLVLSLPGALLFDLGSSDLAPGGREVLRAVARLLGNVRNSIEVAGHADPRRPTGGYASNWELSLARSLKAAEVLGGYGYRGRVLVRGYGESRYAELPADLPLDRRRALARRVEIVIRPTAEAGR